MTLVATANAWRMRPSWRDAVACALWRGVILAAWLAATVAARGQSLELQPVQPIVNSTTPFNVHFVVAEEFLNRFVAREDVEPGRVDDFVFGAKVDGEQCTRSRVRLDLRPGIEQAAGAFVLEGQVNSFTIGRTEQGAVQNVGQQEFLAIKDVFFDGMDFSTRHAAVFVRASNQPVAAYTQLDGTILQSLGQKFALYRAEQQRPQTEAYARNRVADRVYPTFDGSIDEQLATANQRFAEDLRPALQRVNLMPSQQRVSSTEHHLHYAARMARQSGDDVPFATPGRSLAGAHAVTLYLHDSLLNGLIDRLRLNGRKTSDRELRSLFDRVREIVPGQGLLEDSAPVEGEPANGTQLPGMNMTLETQIEFDADRPLEVHFRNGEMVIELRATLKPAGQTLLPPLVIATPLRLVRRGEEWQLVRGQIQITSATSERLPSVADQLIRQAIERGFPSVAVPGELPIPNWPATQRRLILSDLQAADGWLAISID